MTASGPAPRKPSDLSAPLVVSRSVVLAELDALLLRLEAAPALWQDPGARAEILDLRDRVAEGGV